MAPESDPYVRLVERFVEAVVGLTAQIAGVETRLIAAIVAVGERIAKAETEIALVRADMHSVKDIAGKATAALAAYVETDAERARLEQQTADDLREERRAKVDTSHRIADMFRAFVASREVTYVLLAIAVWALSQLGIQAPAFPAPEAP